VEQKFGVPPERVVDILALTGDAIDNIKGVPGIGEKGARDLIGTYGSLDALLEHAPEVTQKKYREALLANADLARQSRELARLRFDAPVSFEIENFRYKGPDRQACFALFSQLGFRTLLSEYAPDASSTVKDYRLVETTEAVAALAGELREAGRFAVRALTTQGAAVQAELVGLAFSFGQRHARYVPLRHRALDSGPQADARAALAALAPVFEDPAIGKVGHDVKLECVILAGEGIALQGTAFDTMLASYLLDATRSSHPLDPRPGLPPPPTASAAPLGVRRSRALVAALLRRSYDSIR
jgi:DNA polymerase-1